jgi:hypothetical protein
VTTPLCKLLAGTAVHSKMCCCAAFSVVDAAMSVLPDLGLLCLAALSSNLPDDKANPAAACTLLYHGFPAVALHAAPMIVTRAGRTLCSPNDLNCSSCCAVCCCSLLQLCGPVPVQAEQDTLLTKTAHQLKAIHPAVVLDADACCSFAGQSPYRQNRSGVVQEGLRELAQQPGDYCLTFKPDGTWIPEGLTLSFKVGRGGGQAALLQM